MAGEFLDPAAVDRLLVRAHTESQRLDEDLSMAQRFAERSACWPLSRLPIAAGTGVDEGPGPVSFVDVTV